MQDHEKKRFQLMVIIVPNHRISYMKQISEVEETPFTSSLNLCPEACAGIFKQSMGAGNRVEIGLSYRPASL
jgi:hypothetical protein